MMSPALSGETKWPPKALHVLAVCGASALVLGLIFVVAFNWAGLGKLAKFALLQGLIIALTLAAIARGLNTTLGKGLLVMAIGCLGPLLAVFGQTYQTGADVWQLFAGWAGLSLVWALAARSGAGWLVWVIIAQTALWLYLNAFHDLSRLSVGRVPLWVIILALNGGLLAIWEAAASRLSWLSGRLAPRLIAALLLFAMTSAAIHSLFWSRDLPLLHPVLGWLALMVAGFLWYGRGRRDIVMVTLGWVALAALALALVIKVLVKIDLIFTVFICFFMALGLLALGIRWLRKNFAGSNHWIVDLAAAFGAWISMLLMVLLVGLLVGKVLAETPPFWFVMSVMAACAAIWLARTSSREQVFRRQLVNVFALAAPTLAYLGVVVTRGTHYKSNALLAVYLACAVALALWVLLRSKQARALMSICVIYGVIAALHHFHLGALSLWLLLAAACAIWLWAPNSFLREQTAIDAAADNVQIQRLTEFGYAASLWAILIGAGYRSQDSWGFWYAFWRVRDDREAPFLWTHLPWLPAALAMIIAIVVATVLIRKLNASASTASQPLGSASVTFGTWFNDSLVIGLAIIATGLCAWYAPYLLVCAILFALGVATERLKLTVLATFGIVAALFEYYFELTQPLWLKGSVLALLGTLLLMMTWRGSRFKDSTQNSALNQTKSSSQGAQS